MAELKERIIFVENEGNQFAIYFDGTTHYDEDYYGKPIEKENCVYLDNNLNTFVMNVGKDNAKSDLNRFLIKGIPAFIGPHSPETEVIREVKQPNGKMIFQEVEEPNTNPNTVGIWRMSTKEEKQKYKILLDKQAKEAKSIKLAM